MSKQIQRRLKKSATPAVVRYEIQIIITPETTKHRTSIVFISHRQTLSSPQNGRNFNTTTVSGPYKNGANKTLQTSQTTLATINVQQLKNRIIYLNAYLCLYADSYLMLINLPKPTTSRKLVIKVTETRLFVTSRKQLFHKPKFMLNVDYP